MSKTPGISLQLNDAIYFIPEEDLASYRIPDAAATELRTDLAQMSDDVAGFAQPRTKTPFVPVRAAFGIMQPNLPAPKLGYTEEDFITFSRVH